MVLVPRWPKKPKLAMSVTRRRRRQFDPFATPPISYAAVGHRTPIRVMKLPSNLAEICPKSLKAARTKAMMMTPRSFRFGPFKLDLERLCLDGPSGQADLRRKSFEVLRYLLEHAGRV